MLAIDKYRSKWSNEEAKLIIEWFKELDYIRNNLKVNCILQSLDEAMDNELGFLKNGYKLYLDLLVDKLLNEGEMNEIVTLNAIMQEIKENYSLIDLK